MRLKGHKVEGPRSLSSPAAAAQLLTVWMSVNDTDWQYLEIPKYGKQSEISKLRFQDVKWQLSKVV